MAETKRKIQRRTAQLFIEWLNEGRLDSDLRRVQEDVTGFIMGAIDTHNFSELSGRRGPYGAQFDDFFSLDLQQLRTLSVKAAARSELEALSDDPDAPFPFSPQDFKYDLYIFSNFLTEVDTVERAKEQLKKLFYWLSLGQSLVVLGGTNPPYPYIYERLKIIAAKTRLNQIDELSFPLPCSYDDLGAQLIHYNSVISHMRSIHPNLSIPDELANARDLWDPDVPLNGPKQFSVRLFSRRRLLPGQRRRRKKVDR